MAAIGVWMVSVPVSDQDRAKTFYRDVLGFEETADVSMGDTMRWVQLTLPGSETSITLVTWFETMAAGSLRGLVLRVDDIDATVAELGAKGVAVPGGVEAAPWGRFVQIADPDGNGILLQQAPS